MTPWRPEDEERVNPTVRWLFRGLWTVLLAIVIVLVTGALLNALT
ncbi:MAG TPA: hypothetical protein VHF67_09845 [Gaiellaceae bacterium]|nr:hypothetical protein [Gaiellaceae bacterium]